MQEDTGRETADDDVGSLEDGPEDSISADSSDTLEYTEEDEGAGDEEGAASSEGHISQAGTPSTTGGRIFRIKILHSSETHLVEADPQTDYAVSSHVVVMTRYGRDIGRILGAVNSQGHVGSEDILKIERVATKEDIERRKAMAIKEKEAFRICQERILGRNMQMKLVSAHYLMDEPKILFFFTAEARVDFRELVKDLVSHFKTRIELRQIGVRDEARVLGGLGVCGRVFCCHHVTDKLNAVSIKMAKDQNLSLNSMKISGPCGRLLCCLAYESQLYRDERRGLPSEGAKIGYEGGTFKVTEINVLRSLVRLSGEDGRVVKLPARRFKRGEDGRWMVLPETPAT
jgi:cell fate regulator YaaT (PSP1 superfamily)